MHLAHAGKHLDIANVEFVAGAHCAQHCLAGAGGAMHLKPHIDQALDNVLNLLF